MRYLVYILAFFLLTGGYHPVYVSITTIDQKDSTLQITVRAFSEDIQKAVIEGKSVQNDAISDYVMRNLRITVKGKTLPLQYIGFEKEDDIYFFYFETVLRTDMSQVKVTQQLLLEVFEQQTNIVHYKKMNRYSTGLCTREKPEVDF
jgi:hypothetical protein